MGARARGVQGKHGRNVPARKRASPEAAAAASESEMRGEARGALGFQAKLSRAELLLMHSSASTRPHHRAQSSACIQARASGQPPVHRRTFRWSKCFAGVAEQALVEGRYRTLTCLP